MRRLDLTTLSLALVSLFTSMNLTTASAATTETISITAPSHRLLNGQFVDDVLASDLSPAGKIGSLVFLNNSSRSRWAVDPALIEEVVDMSDGYKLSNGTAGSGEDIAKNFLSRLSNLATAGRIDAMIYGDPSEYWIQRLTPHEHNYILSASEKRLAALFKTNVGPVNKYLHHNYFKLPGQSVVDIKNDYEVIQNSAIYMDPLVLDDFRLAITRLLNPEMDSKMRAILVDDLNQTVTRISQNIRLAPGRFTVTSSQQKLPITIINDFPGVANVNLMIYSLNERVLVHDIEGVKVPGRSKVQVLVPVKVLTSGSSGLSITIENLKGDQIGESQIYPLSLKVISPIATWITTAAAVILFIGALLQSLRRIRRRGMKDHENE